MIILLTTERNLILLLVADRDVKFNYFKYMNPMIFPAFDTGFLKGKGKV